MGSECKELMFHKAVVYPCFVSNFTDVNLVCRVSVQLLLYTACQLEKLRQTWILSMWHWLHACGIAALHNITSNKQTSTCVQPSCCFYY